jgi:hypothetical protein
VLQAQLQKFLKYKPAISIRETRSEDDIPQANLDAAGEATDVGFELKHTRRVRFSIQETLRPGGKSAHQIVHYTYAFVDVETGERLFRFEYHPYLSSRSHWPQIHHVHVESIRPGVPEIHFPIWPFYDSPDEHPDEVLPRVLDWCKDQVMP